MAICARKEELSCTSNCNSVLQRSCFQHVPARWVVGIMGFFGTFTVYILRVNFSTAIVAMVDFDEIKRVQEEITQNYSFTTPGFFDSSPISTRCENPTITRNNSLRSNAYGRKFVWNENTQGLVLGSYFYGYVCSQVFGAWMGRKLGRVRVWGTCLLLASIFTVLIPRLSDLGVSAIVTSRNLIGLFSGVSYPLIQGMWSNWAPPEERSKLLTLHFAGAPTGTLIMLPLSGILATEFGWESIFYVTGACGILWSIFWLALMFDSPAQHPRISEKERRFIQRSLGEEASKSEVNHTFLPMSVPWISILTSMKFLCTMIPHFASNFATFIFLTMLPKYLFTIMNLDLKSSAALSAIPHVAKLSLFLFTGFLADYLISKGVRTIVVRKIWSSVGLFLPGAAMIFSAYVGCNIPLVMFLFSVPDALDTFTIAGHKAAMLDIAPAFAGVTFAICNTLASSSGFLAPQIVGLLLEANKHNPIKGWRSLFWMGGIMYFVGGAVFLIFGSSEEQDWAKRQESTNEDNKREGKTEMTTQAEGDGDDSDVKIRNSIF